MAGCPVDIFCNVTLSVDPERFGEPNTDLHKNVKIHKKNSHFDLLGTFKDIEASFVKLHGTCKESHKGPTQRSSINKHTSDSISASCVPVEPVEVESVVMNYITKKCSAELKRLIYPVVSMKTNKTQVTFHLKDPGHATVFAHLARERFIRFYQKIATELQTRSYYFEANQLQPLLKMYPELLVNVEQEETDRITITGRFICLDKFEQFFKSLTKRPSRPISYNEDRCATTSSQMFQDKISYTEDMAAIASRQMFQDKISHTKDMGAAASSQMFLGKINNTEDMAAIASRQMSQDKISYIEDMGAAASSQMFSGKISYTEDMGAAASRQMFSGKISYTEDMGAAASRQMFLGKINNTEDMAAIASRQMSQDKISYIEDMGAAASSQIFSGKISYTEDMGAAASRQMFSGKISYTEDMGAAASRQMFQDKIRYTKDMDATAFSQGKINYTEDMDARGFSHVIQDQISDVEETCCICLEQIVKSQMRTLEKCKHSFCSECLKRSFEIKPVCPTCGVIYSALKGNQPKTGKMKVSYQKLPLPGYENYGTIAIHYIIPSGLQGDEHPNPGQPYEGAVRIAYLPDSTEGNKVLKLLQQAFKQRLIFTIGRSSTTGRNNVVTWNDIHHKTSPTGGPTTYGYPDPDYLKRVQEELKVKGIY